jgi:hypothetical protein
MKRLLLLSLLCAGPFACSVPEGDSSVLPVAGGASKPQAAAIPPSIPSLRRERTSGEVALIVRDLASAAGVSVDIPTITSELAKPRARAMVAGAWASSTEKTVVHYHPREDDLSVRFREVPAAAGTPDVGADVARSTARSYAMKVAAMSSVGARQVDIDNPKLTPVRQGIGQDEQVLREDTVEYRYRFSRVLNGIPFANDGIMVAVSRDGRISRVRVVSVQIPDAALAGLLPANAKQVEAQRGLDFDKQNPDAHVYKKQLAYVYDKAHGAVEPRLLVEYAPTFMVQGLRSVNRQRSLALSLTGSADWDLTPLVDPNAVGDTK